MKKKRITMIKNTAFPEDFRIWVRYKNHREETPTNLVFTDGYFDFHLNEYSCWKVKQVSFDWGETWVDFNIDMLREGNL